MHIGFTGTRNGMTEEQKKTVSYLLQTIDGEVFHHGDCIGADAEAHDLAKKAGYEVVIHPPLKQEFRAFCDGTVLMEKNYLDRNKDIADDAEVLIATPSTFQEERRSGTWSTVRYGAKNKKVLIVQPNGMITSYTDIKRLTFK